MKKGKLAIGVEVAVRKLRGISKLGTRADQASKAAETLALVKDKGISLPDFLKAT